jgi:2-polyprenyl-6-hydroxyphenyl methylase/3-demethylubiquinone-9 3-methyltransferase
MNRAIISKETSNFYGDHWERYPLRLEEVRKHLIDLFPEGLEGKSVLDAGCGSGMVSIAFATLGCRVLGVDASDQCVINAINRSRQLGVAAVFERHDLTSLDLGGRSFDIIYCWGVLHHTTDARRGFDRLVAHMAPSGKIVIAVYLKTWLSGFWNFSRVFYRKSPEPVKALTRKCLSMGLNGVDHIRRHTTGRQPPDMRGTNNEELVNDWFGVPQRSFHGYEEVFGWFRSHDLAFRLTNPMTGRFRSTSNFEVMGWKENP